MGNNKGGLGLDDLGNLSSFLKEEKNTNNGKPLNIEIEKIDEDPEQPRKTFTKSTLKELAESIKTRGVKTPISVRSTGEGRYMINHGARRFRASILAEKTTIPAYVDSDYSKADQIIENIHRDNLTPREIAEYIGRQVSAGQKKGEIASELGKSRSFVTHHHTLLNLPDELASLYNSGKCNDVTVLYDFSVLYKKEPDDVIDWIGSHTGEWNRANVKLFKEYLESKNNPEENQGNQEIVKDNQNSEEDQDNQEVVNSNQDLEKKENILVNGVIIVKFKGKNGKILLNRIPSEEGRCWVEFDQEIVDIKMNTARFVSLIEG